VEPRRRRVTVIVTEALGGSFTVESPPGSGTRIRTVLPLSEWSP
jgi:chemotaxis protein histidine kinase CheA